MDLNLKNNHHSNTSPSPSSSTSSTTHPTTTTTTNNDHDPMQSWWESVSKARSRILSLSSILPSNNLSSLADSDRPALSLLSSSDAYALVSSTLSVPSSGSGSDPICHWLYDTYLSSDPHLRLIVISFIPLIINLYLSRLHSSHSSSLPSLAGFEAVLLAIYSSEAKSRAGKPLLVQIPDLTHPSLYHTPRNKPAFSDSKSRPSVGVLSPPLEPQIAVKSTKRASIVGVAFDSYFKQISHMPTCSKVDLCQFAAAWAGQDCCCKYEFDHNRCIENGHDDIDQVVNEMGKLGIQKGDGTMKGVRIPLPWELLQPMLRILGHCLLGPLNSQDVKDAASVAVRCLYARGSHDLVPQAILATRSLIQLDKRARESIKAAAAANASSNANTPSKAKKPEILLVSK